MVHQKAWRKIQKVAKEKDWNQKWKADVKEISKEEKNEIWQELWNKKKMPMKIRSLNLKMQVGTGDVILTSYAVAILSIVTSILLTVLGKEKWRKDYQYIFYPSYQDRPVYSIFLTATIQIRIWELLHIAWILYRWKKSKEKGRKEAILAH